MIKVCVCDCCCFSGAVLSLTMGESGDSCYSGGLDGSVRCWKMPDLNVDPYDNYGPPSSPAAVHPSLQPRGLTPPSPPSRSGHREQRAGGPRGRRVGSDLLHLPPPAGLLLRRRHRSHLGPAELGALPVRLQQGER